MIKMLKPRVKVMEPRIKPFKAKRSRKSPDDILLTDQPINIRVIDPKEEPKG